VKSQVAMAEGNVQQAWRYEPRKNDPPEVNQTVFIICACSWAV